MSRYKVVLVSLIVCAISATVAVAQIGGGFDLSWMTADSGGATFSSGNGYRLGGTIGQPDAAASSGGVYSVQGGFWRGAILRAQTSTPTASATSTATRTAPATKTSTRTPTATPSRTATATATRSATPSATATTIAVETVSWIDVINASVGGSGLTRNSSGAAWSSGATSSRGIASGSGYVEATVGANDTLIFGLASGNDDQTGNDVEFGIFFNGSARTAQASENNSVNAPAVSFSPGDTFRVAVEAGPVVRYYKNGSAFYTNSTPSLRYPLRLDTALYSPGATVGQAKIAGVLVNVTPRSAGSLGSCANVSWNGNPGYTTNVSTGTAPFTFIRKSGGAPNAWDAGSSSTQVYSTTAAPISAQAVISASTDYFMFGLSKSPDSGVAPGGINWGFYGYGANGLLKVVSNGAVYTTLGNMTTGQLLRIAFNNRQVRFYSNDVPVLVVNYPVNNPNFPALLDTSFYNPGAGLKYVQLCTNGSDPVANSAIDVELAAMPTVSPLPTASAGFSDVRATDYYYAAVTNLSGRGVISGYADDTFRPYAAVTRGQLAKIVVLASGELPHTPARPSFADVSSGSPFYNYVEAALWMGMVAGYDDGTFRPNQPVTRGQLAKMVVLGLSLPLADSATLDFRDVSTQHAFSRYIATAAQAGLLNGYDDNTFRPAANATRGQVVKVVYQATQPRK